MTREKLEHALKRYADAKRRHAVDEILDLVTEDSVYEDRAFGTHVQGKDALRAWYGRLFEDLPDYFGEFEGEAYGDNVAVVWGHWGGTVGESFMGAPTRAGNQLRIPVTFVCFFTEDGLLERDLGYFDAGTLREQAGIDAMALAAQASSEGEQEPVPAGG